MLIIRRNRKKRNMEMLNFYHSLSPMKGKYEFTASRLFDKLRAKMFFRQVMEYQERTGRWGRK